MKCSNCGNDIDEGAKFCSNCGMKVEIIENEQHVEEVKQNIEEQKEEEIKQPVVGEVKIEKSENAGTTVNEEENKDDISIVKDDAINIEIKREGEDVDATQDITSEAIEGEKSKENFITKFIKKHVNNIDEGPIIKNKFVIICFIITGVFIAACLIIFIVYNIYLNTLLTKV